MSYDRRPPPRPPRPPRKTRPGKPIVPVLWATGAVVLMVGLFLFAAGVGTFGSADTVAATPTTGRATTAAPVKKGPGLRDPVRDGKFQFVVSKVDCSRTTVGLEHLKRTAAGRFCQISVSVKNIADKPQFFLSSAQEAYDTAGAKYSDDDLAGFYANRDSQTFLRKIDPGHTVTGKIVFDVPKSATLATIELHDSYFSGGVKVTLR